VAEVPKIFEIFLMFNGFVMYRRDARRLRRPFGAKVEPLASNGKIDGMRCTFLPAPRHR
jgi:hypothetical protein